MCWRMQVVIATSIIKFWAMNKKTKSECLNVIKTRNANVVNMNTNMLSEKNIMGSIWYESVIIMAQIYVTNSVANYTIVY